MSSLGTWAHFGYPAMPESVMVLKDRDIDITGHRSRPLDVAELRAADIVVAMTSVHIKELLNIAPDVGSKLILLKELVELALDGELPPTAEARIRRLLGAPRPEWRRALDLDDPIGKPIGAYEKTAIEIEMAVEVLVNALCDAQQLPSEPSN